MGEQISVHNSCDVKAIKKRQAKTDAITGMKRANIER